MDQQATAQLAELAHRLWCAAMRAGGWIHGAAYDPGARTHDALTDWSRLSAQDRRHACLGIEAAELGGTLIGAIRYQRGPDREFTAEEMRPGLPVAFDNTPPRPPWYGVVEAWEVDDSGLLSGMRVRFEGGEVVDYHPAFREVRRLTDAERADPGTGGS